MNKLMLFAMSMMLWCTTSLADLPSEQARENLQVISQWTDHLNAYYTDLALKPQVTDITQAPQVLRELLSLEDYLHGEGQLSPGALQTLACSRCVCVGCAGGQSSQ
jgi:hypothetical protein